MGSPLYSHEAPGQARKRAFPVSSGSVSGMKALFRFVAGHYGTTPVFELDIDGWEIPLLVCVAGPRYHLKRRIPSRSGPAMGMVVAFGLPAAGKGARAHLSSSMILGRPPYSLLIFPMWRSLQLVNTQLGLGPVPRTGPFRLHVAAFSV
jgi:hypothetical protein